MLLQRHAERGSPLGRSAESLQKWREMAVFQRNSSVCTLVGPGGLWVGCRERLSVVSFYGDQGELTDNRPPQPAVSHGISWLWTSASFARELGAAIALRAQGDGAGGARDVQGPHPSSFILHPSSCRWSRRCAGCSGTLTHPGAEGAAHLDLLLDYYAP